MTSIPLGPVDRAILSQRSFGSVLGDVVTSAFPTWTVGIQVGYPLGTSTQQTNLARAKLQYAQAQTQLRNLELQIVTQVRDSARTVQTNQKRVESARAARELAEKRLDAEEKKFAAGIQTTFFVFQAQRDLAQARTNEVRAISDYNKSLVDLEAVQEVGGGGGGVTSAGAGAIQTGNAIVRQLPPSLLPFLLPLYTPRVPKLSVTVITRNEAADIGEALTSVAWADELIVVDSVSTDDTVAIARQHTDRVIVREWPGYVAQKNYAASIASHDWILSLDADERVTPELADEITSTLAGTPSHRGYRIPRVTWHLGRWIRTTDWYPDHQLRLYDRRAAEWTGRLRARVDVGPGPVGRLRGELQHFAYRDIADHLETIDRYTTYAARQMHENGRPSGFVDLAIHPPLAFLRNYVLKAGIRDGVPGFVISAMNAYYVFLKFAKLWEIQRLPPSRSHGEHEGPTEDPDL